MRTVASVEFFANKATAKVCELIKEYFGEVPRRATFLMEFWNKAKFRELIKEDNIEGLCKVASGEVFVETSEEVIGEP